MAFKVRYHKNALADLEAIFDWSRKNHPEATKQFFDGLFDHLDSLAAFRYMGFRSKACRASGVCFTHLFTCTIEYTKTALRS
ncbi:MAG: type II toxin-antitoxin system RelE/ParE family toxin [Acidobacteriaceae bacterium]|nr:type II toxin-antitoxin system RelE/ParE family toxin [Acidobacteriaceae bacterium]MBV9765742.1 type II toxin-antitoxin system RelE/ParE family toxin [Acidobacteriaceae bacterium]